MRHADVADEDVRFFLPQERQRFAGRGGDQDPGVARRKEALGDFAGIGLVIHDQDLEAGERWIAS